MIDLRHRKSESSSDLSLLVCRSTLAANRQRQIIVSCNAEGIGHCDPILCRSLTSSMVIEEAAAWALQPLRASWEWPGVQSIGCSERQALATHHGRVRRSPELHEFGGVGQNFLASPSGSEGAIERGERVWSRVALRNAVDLPHDPIAYTTALAGDAQT